MDKRNKKVITIITAASLALSIALISPVKPVFASTLVPVTRLGGTTRYATSASLATANGKKSVNAVLVSGDNAYDAISATVLAHKLDAPLLLTSSNSLDSNAAAALILLDVKNVYIVGNSSSISQSVRDSIKALYSLTEIYGADKYATNIAVANYLVNKLGVSASKVLVAGGEGWSDALSVAPVATGNGEILLLANNNTIEMAGTNKFVKYNNSTVTVVGTSNVIGSTELSALNNATRINGGADRFATNLIVNKAFASELISAITYVANATGDGFADALVASTKAGVTKSPLIILDTQTSQSTANALYYIKAIAPKTAVNVVGGSGVITSQTLSNINAAVNVVGASPITIVAQNSTKISAPYGNTMCPTGLGFYMNSADGIHVYWNAANKTGKTISNYTVNISMYNTFGDPAYSEINGSNKISVKNVGPVLPNNYLLINSIVAYSPVCSKIVIDSIYLQYSDGTSETVPYGYSGVGSLTIPD